MSKLIYVADDERTIRELVKEYLVNEGFKVELFENGKVLLDAFFKTRPDMVIIDVMMPELDGLSVCKKIRGESDIPIIIVSAKDDEIDRIVGLEMGSDDYLSKPFSPRELVIRAKKLFDRIDKITRSQINKNIMIGDLTIDIDGREIKKDHIVLDMTMKEMDLLIELSENKGRVFTRDQLIKKIWGYEFIGETRAIDDLVKRIRKKLKEADSSAQIETVWGYGYKAIDGEKK